MKTLSSLQISLVSSSLLVAGSALGQIVFQDSFDLGTSGSAWTAKLSHADAFANFAFDYSTIGIPSAPHSVGGTTIGMSFLANQSAAVQQGVSASPNGLSIAGGFKLEFDMWLNFNGPLGLGGSGSTHVGSFGWGTSGDSAQWAGASSSLMFGATGDGGSSYDYRAYRNNALDFGTAGVYAAGTGTAALNNTATYYTDKFGAASAPAAQLTLYPNQTGTTAAGALGFAWRDVVVERIGDSVTWTVDGYLMASLSAADATLSGDNIFFGQFDINGSSSGDANDFLITSVYDNIVVTVPEPSVLALSALGALALLARRRHA